MLPPLFLGANLDSVDAESPFRSELPLGVEPHHTVLDLCAVPLHKPSLWASLSEGNKLQHVMRILYALRISFFFKRCICMNTKNPQFHLWQQIRCFTEMPPGSLSAVSRLLVASGAWLEDFPNAGGKPTSLASTVKHTSKHPISPGHALATSRKRSPSKWFCLELGISMSFELLSVVKGWCKRIA